MTLSRAMRGADVGRVQQVFPGVGVDRDAPGREGFGVSEEVASRRQQDTAILVLHRAGGAAVPHRLPGRNQRSMRSAIQPASVSVSSSGKNCTSTLP